MSELGVKIDHSTLNRWVVHYAPKLERAFHKLKKRPGKLMPNHPYNILMAS